MKLHLFPPALIFRHGSKWGRARGPLVWLAHDDAPHQLPHELVHVWQWWIITALTAAVLAGVAHVVPALPYGVTGLSIGVTGALTALSPAYRWWSEVQAYRVSYRASPERLDDFARMLFVEYSTGRTFEQCRAALIR